MNEEIDEYSVKYDFSSGEMVVFIIEKFLFSNNLGVEIKNIECLGIVIKNHESVLTHPVYDSDYYIPNIKYYQVHSVQNGRLYIVSENKMKPHT